MILCVSRGVSIGNEGSTHELAALQSCCFADGDGGIATEGHTKHTSIDKSSLKSTVTKIV